MVRRGEEIARNIWVAKLENITVMDNGGFREYFMRSVAPVCISALIAIAIGLVAMFVIGGFSAFVVTVILVACGFIVGWRQGERLIAWLRGRELE